MPGESTIWLMNELAQRFTAALEGMTGERPHVNWKRTKTDPGKEAFWWVQPFTVAENAVVHAGVPGKTWREIGQFILRAAGIEEAEDADAQNTFLEILNQAFSGLAQGLTARLSREITCEAGRKVENPNPEAAFFALEITLPAGLLPPVCVGVAPALLDAVRVTPRPSNAPAAVEREATTLNVPARAPVTQNSKTLDLLMEVELPVSISFGRAQLPLKDALKLTTGSIVELNRTVTEPVEVIVNNCVIARGEVVVIEGNYGVKIDQIVSRQERLRTLK